LAALGFSLCFSGYLLYGHYLGRHDGQPLLPPEHRCRGPRDIPELSRTEPSPARYRLIHAFGPACEEQHRPIQFELRGQGIVVAADRWEVKDGHLQFENISLALFGDPRTGTLPVRREFCGQNVEIYSIRGAQAWIEFDAPIEHLNHLGERTPVGGHLAGRFSFRYQRRASNRLEDDLQLELVLDRFSFQFQDLTGNQAAAAANTPETLVERWSAGRGFSPETLGAFTLPDTRQVLLDLGFLPEQADFIRAYAARPDLVVLRLARHGSMLGGLPRHAVRNLRLTGNRGAQRTVLERKVRC
jgi:hypothetical protein